MLAQNCNPSSWEAVGGGERCAFEKNPELPSETWVHVGQKVELMLGWEALVRVWAP